MTGEGHWDASAWRCGVARGSPLRVAEVMVRCPKTHRPESSVNAIRALFEEDDHVHMVLIVGPDGRLVTTIERSDLPCGTSSCTVAGELGTLAGRTVAPGDSLDAAYAALLRGRRRRLAVIDDGGRLVGLLCLNRAGNGYCSDDGIRARAVERQQERASGLPAEICRHSATPAAVKDESPSAGTPS